MPASVPLGKFIVRPGLLLIVTGALNDATIYAIGVTVPPRLNLRRDCGVTPVGFVPCSVRVSVAVPDAVAGNVAAPETPLAICARLSVGVVDGETFPVA